MYCLGMSGSSSSFNDLKYRSTSPGVTVTSLITVFCIDEAYSCSVMRCVRISRNVYMGMCCRASSAAIEPSSAIIDWICCSTYDGTSPISSIESIRA